MMHLWQAEWLKTRKRPANLGILAVALGIFLVMYVGMVIFGLYYGRDSGQAKSVLAFMQYPNGLNTGLFVLGSIGGFMGIVFMANIIGSEYSRDTWKMILPRQGSRLSFLWTKLAMTFFAIILLMVISMIVAQLLGFISALILGANLTTSLGNLSDILYNSIYTFMSIAFSAMLTLFVTVVTRSTIGGIVTGFVTFQIFSVAVMMSKVAAMILPNAHLQNIFGKLVAREGEMRDSVQMQLQMMFGKDVPVSTSLLVVGAYIAVFIISAVWLFKNRDIAGN